PRRLPQEGIGRGRQASSARRPSRRRGYPLQRAQRRRTGQRQPQRQPRRQNRPGAWPREGDVPSDVRHSGHHRFSDHPSHRIASRIAARKRVRSLPKNREVDETWPKSTPKCPRRQKNGGSGVATVKQPSRTTQANTSQLCSFVREPTRSDVLQVAHTSPERLRRGRREPNPLTSRVGRPRRLWAGHSPAPSMKEESFGPKTALRGRTPGRPGGEPRK